MNDAVPLDYASLLREVKQRIRAAQLAALRQVNRELVGLYADIGRLIVSRQEGEIWGKRVVANLARDLQSEFPGAAVFSAANLWRMKLFHETYGADEKLAPLVREIGWSHDVVILEKCKDPAEREFSGERITLNDYRLKAGRLGSRLKVA
jgi:predicted nuclease of restriction endonuclease-like (RecB) superfamily